MKAMYLNYTITARPVPTEWRYRNTTAHYMRMRDDSGIQNVRVLVRSRNCRTGLIRSNTFPRASTQLKPVAMGHATTFAESP